jgi:predicted RNase H-like HicB family nuclease
MATKSEPAMRSQRYLYSVGWSEPDRAFVARVAEFPSLSAHGDNLEAALQEIRFVVEAVIEDLEQSGERIPEPIGTARHP